MKASTHHTNQLYDHISHNKSVERLRVIIKDTPEGNQKLSFTHGSSNSTRRSKKNNNKIDISMFGNIIEINMEEKYIHLEPNVSMDTLVKKLLPYNLLPPVVPEFPGITVGGAINGASLESSSFKWGQFNDSCFEYEIITASGELIIANAQTYSDLFYGISGSYGTLGIIVGIKIKLEQIKPYVQVVGSIVDTKKSIVEIKNVFTQYKVDFCEAVVLSKDKTILLKGSFVDTPSENYSVLSFTKKSDSWYIDVLRNYSNRDNFTFFVPIYDYIFRYDKGAFWMGEYFFKLFRLPASLFWKRTFNNFMNTRKLYDALQAFNIAERYIIQDLYIPVESAQDFLTESMAYTDIFPIWLCPVLPTTLLQKLSPHYTNTTSMMIDIGIYGSSNNKKISLIEQNKYLENLTSKTGGRKMLYAHNYYSLDDFWRIYDRSWYQQLRNLYSASKSLPDIFTKLQNKKTEPRPIMGTLELLRDWIVGKNLS